MCSPVRVGTRAAPATKYSLTCRGQLHHVRIHLGLRMSACGRSSSMRHHATRTGTGRGSRCSRRRPPRHRKTRLRRKRIAQVIPPSVLPGQIKRSAGEGPLGRWASTHLRAHPALPISPVAEVRVEAATAPAWRASRCCPRQKSRQRFSMLSSSRKLFWV